MLKEIIHDLNQLKNDKKIAGQQRFFKTGKGEYGEGDVFIGVSVPELRKIARKYRELDFSSLHELLSSEIHEYRLTALFILRLKYERTKNDNDKGEICDFLIENRQGINNWDLVDSSAHYILGDYLLDKDKDILYKFAKSENLWERRIAIMTTFGFIKKGKFDDTLKISEILLEDNHDLIHKAVGWMLREIGNRNQEVEEKFLKKHYKKMPRVMLRYAIEKFDLNKKALYMQK